MIIVSIYSGIIPSTTFIERLILGLSQNHVKIILVGRKTQRVNYTNKNIVINSFGNDLEMVIKGIFYCLVLKKKTKEVISKLKKRNWKEKLKLYAIVGPLVKHKCNLFHIQWAKDLENWMFLQELGIKVVLSLRGAHINYSPMANADLALSYSFNFPKVNGFHAVSDAIGKVAQEYGAAEKKIKLIYSGFDLTDFQYHPKSNFGMGKLKVISIGRPHWKKGYQLALDALQRINLLKLDWTYTIVGGIDEELLFQIHQLGFKEQVLVKSRLTQEEIKTILLEHDVLLLPSVEEGVANVVLEAMALGTLVLSSDCGGMTEVINHSSNGFIFKNRNIEHLTEILKLISKLELAEVNKITSNARETIEKQHNQDQMVQGFKQLYLEII